jgi:hypothetical protein
VLSHFLDLNERPSDAVVEVFHQHVCFGVGGHRLSVFRNGNAKSRSIGAC